MAVVQAAEGWEEGYGCGGEVHHEVRDGLGDGYGSRRWWGEFRGAGVADWEGDGVLILRSELEEGVCCFAHKGVAVGAVWPYKL